MTYSRSSHFTVPFTDFKTKTYTCIVKHTAITKTGGEQRPITNKDCLRSKPKPIQVHLLTPDCNAENTETTLELACVLFSSGPGQADVEWLVNGAVQQPKVKVTLTGNEGDGHSSYIRRPIAKNSWDKGDHYTCRVTQLPNVQNVQMFNTSKCQACYKSMQVPTVSITKPSYRDLVDGTANVTCLVEGSFLENANITWNIDGRPSTEPQTEIVKTVDGGRQNAESRHPVSLQQWERGTTFQCKVVSMCFEEITKDVTIKQDTDVPIQKPVIKVFQAYREVSSDSPIAQMLVCEVSGFSPMEITIIWMKNNMPLSPSLYDNGPVVASKNAYSTYSILKIGRNELGDSLDSYTSVVYHSSSAHPITKRETLSPVPDCSARPVKVETIPPSFSDIYLNKSVTLTCRISNLPYEQDLDQLNVFWTRERNNKELETIIGEATEQETCGLVSIDATVTVYTEEWESNDTFTCKVTLPLLPTAEIRTLRRFRDTGSISKAPAVYVLPPPSEQLALRENVTVTCLLKGFYPNDFFVQWLRNNEPVRVSEYFTSTPILESKTPERYFTYSTLNVSEQDWSYGATYTCVVGHESLPYRTTQKTIDKNTGLPKPTPPQVKAFHTSEEEEDRNLICLGSNFHPESLDLQWSASGTNFSCSNGNHHKSCTLTLSRKQWRRPQIYSCTVSHSSTNIFIQKVLHSAAASAGPWDWAVVTSADICVNCSETQDESCELTERDGAWNRASTYLILFLLSLFYGGLVTFYKVK